MSHRRLEFDVHDKNKEREDDLIDSIDGAELINKRHSTISNDKIPSIGMEFDSEQGAYDFYNAYAKETGFSIRRDVVHTDSDGRILDRVFLCSCQGHRKQDKRDVIIKSRRPETRNGCLAMMKVNGRHTAKYVVQKFVAVHNGHGLASPSKSYFLRSHRTITAAQASQADDIDSSGITPKAGYELMARQRGGRENVGFIFEDYKNYLRSKRTMEMEVGDTRGVLEYLQQRQLEDPNFFYAIQVDQHGMISNIFWADARMRVDFAYFGDVVSFDTTYKKNKEGRPFALFVGVNHHKQTIIFGAALLYDETTDTFMWLFDTFARAMSEKKPQTILTDQDAAMAKALAIQWPETYHRLCIWHIYQNAATHLGSVFSNFPDFSKDFSSCIFDFEEEEDFMDSWQKMIEKYGLETNDWLKRMFNIREKWALVYGRQTFCGDMISTQRSESMNSSLKRYVNSKKSMFQFFQQFQRLIDDRRSQEMQVDLLTSQSTPELLFRVEILLHARNVYTHEVFGLFQIELGKGYDSEIEKCSDVGDISEYAVTPPRKHRYSTVTYNSSTGEVSCTCKKFEFAGILCSHALRMFCSRNIRRVPEKYILKRWTKSAKKWLVGVQPSAPNDKIVEPMNADDESKMIGVRYKELCVLQNQLAAQTSLTVEAYGILKSNIFKSFEDIGASLGKSTTPSDVGPKSNVKETFVSKSSGDALEHSRSTVDGIMIRGLKVRETKNVKSGKRLKSCLEKTTRKRKPKNTSVSSSVTSVMPHDTNKNDGQNINNSGNNLSLSTSTEPSCVSSQLLQGGGSNMSSLSPYYPIQQHSMSPMEAFPTTHVLNTSNFYPINDQHSNSSLMQLLQGQMRLQQ